MSGQLNLCLNNINGKKCGKETISPRMLVCGDCYKAGFRVTIPEPLTSVSSKTTTTTKLTSGDITKIDEIKCQYKLTRGSHKGELCGKKVVKDTSYCAGCAKKKAVLEPVTEEHTCQYIFTKGPRKGTKCGKAVKADEYCGECSKKKSVKKTLRATVASYLPRVKPGQKLCKFQFDTHKSTVCGALIPRNKEYCDSCTKNFIELPNTYRCTYRFIRGARKGQFCGNPTIPGRDYCGQCNDSSSWSKARFGTYDIHLVAFNAKELIHKSYFRDELTGFVFVSGFRSPFQLLGHSTGTPEVKDLTEDQLELAKDRKLTVPAEVV